MQEPSAISQWRLPDDIPERTMVESIYRHAERFPNRLAVVEWLHLASLLKEKHD
jgi:hypothetical protein